MLYTVRCTPYALHCTLYTVHCTLYAVHCTALHFTLYCFTLYVVHCIQHSTVRCTKKYSIRQDSIGHQTVQYSVHCKWYTVRGTFYAVQCMPFLVFFMLYTVLYCLMSYVILSYTVLFCTPYYTVLYCTVLYCNVLRCTIL